MAVLVKFAPSPTASRASSTALAVKKPNGGEWAAIVVRRIVTPRVWEKDTGGS